MNFWKSSKWGRGVIFNPKIYVTVFGNFAHGFLSMKLLKKIVNSRFRVCFYNNCIEKNQNKTQFEEGICMHFILSGPHTSWHICNHIHHKKIAWNFSTNSSNLVAGPFPNDNNDDNVSYITISALKQIVKLYFIFMGPQLKTLFIRMVSRQPI